MGRVRERKGVLWVESGRKKGVGESQGEKRCRGQSGREGESQGEKRCRGQSGREGERKGVGDSQGDKGRVRERKGVGDSQGEKRCDMGRVRESQGEKRCDMGSAKREKMCKVCGLCFVLFLKKSQPPRQIRTHNWRPLRREGDGRITAILRVMAS